MIFRPATPGFIVTLVATILLAIVSFNTPIIKSIYFLKATLTVDNVNGTITLGTLGYCVDLSTNGTTCSSPHVGYSFDLNSLLGDDISFAQIPSVVAKWITYALFLHVIALCAAGVAALFGLLAHVREMSMACCSSFVSGFAAFVALVAFVFDVVLFFVVKKRVQSVADSSGAAQFGGAVWMTLAATILLFFSGCAYACGRCCISRRRPRNGDDGRMENSWMGKFVGGTGPQDAQAEQMRLDAVKAEQERKARQKNEVGLPAFPDRSEVLQPLKHEEDEDEYNNFASGAQTPYRDHHVVGNMAGAGAGGPRRQGSASTAGGQTYRGGYAQAPPGTRAVDEYYAPSSPPARSNANGGAGAYTGYPPNRQYSSSASTPASAYYSHSAIPPSSSPVPGLGVSSAAAAAVGVGAGAGAGYLSAGDHSGAAYGHRGNGTSYHTAASSQHQQYPSAYSQYDPYSQQQQQSTFNAETYNQTAAMLPGVATAYGGGSSPNPNLTRSPPPRQPSQPYADPYSAGSAYSQTQPPPQTTTAAAAAAAVSSNYPNYGTSTAGGSAYQSPTAAAAALDRSYTLGGGGYGANVVPDPSTSSPPPPASTRAANAAGPSYGAPALTMSPPPMMPSANVGVEALNSASTYAYAYGQGQVQGRGQGQGQGQQRQSEGGSSSGYEDAPPGYEANSAVHVPAWGSKA